jgi:hypothetical protein
MIATWLRGGRSEWFEGPLQEGGSLWQSDEDTSLSLDLFFIVIVKE